MKKKIVCFLLCFSTAFAEESGAFVGLGAGLSGVKQEIKGDELDISQLHSGNILTFVNKYGKSHSTTDFGGTFYLGYKHIFSNHWGLRLYLNAQKNRVKIDKPNGKKGFRSYKIAGVSADYLFNFVPNFGVFAGANFGVIAWDKEFWSIDWENDDEKYNAYIAAHLGLRGIFGENKRHAVELVGSLPLNKTTFTYHSKSGEKIADMTLKQSYNLTLRYIYTFALN